MSMRVRSKTGCLTCKNRRKKCDEKRPICDRCTKAKMECLGYSHLDNPPERRPRSNRQRALPSPATGPGPSSHAASAFPSPFPHSTLPSATPESFASGVQHPRPSIDADSFRYLAGTNTNSHDPSTILEPSLFSFSPPTPISQNTAVSHLWLEGSLGALADPNQWFNDTFGTPSHSLPGSSSNISLGPSGLENFGITFGIQPGTLSEQDFSGLFPGQLALPNHQLPSPAISGISSEAFSSPQDLNSFFTNPGDDDSSSTSDDSETEATQVSVYRTLALDKTIINNTLPFVLDSYSKWMSRFVFDPLKLAHQVKGFIYRRFSRSETTRSVTIVKANILRMFVKNLSSTTNLPALSLLADSVHNSIVAIRSTNSPLDPNAEETIDVIGSIVELIYTHELSRPLSNVLSLIEASAPIYRRGCPEPPGEPVNLRSCLLHSDMSMRHFPAIDILFSVKTGRPMCLRYETEEIPEPLENPPGNDNTGLRWVNGIPDDLLVMLAKINTLRADFGTGVDPTTITEVQAQLESFKPLAGTSEDSLVNVMETIVQEAWRQVIYIYIFMGLEGANSADARVAQALKRFIKMLENAKSTRNQDLFLMLPMIIAGIAATRRKDRELIRQRMLNLKECSQPGTCGFDSVQIMSEIWARSGVEARPAVWMDLRLAALKVAGV